MILKLTDFENATVLLPLTNIAIHGLAMGSLLCSLTNTDISLRVKETIEEIEQQIKEGGICVTGIATTKATCNTISLETKLEDMEFSIRVRNSFREAGLETLEQLSKLSQQELLSFNFFGKKSLYEVVDYLEILGIRLRKFKTAGTTNGTN